MRTLRKHTNAVARTFASTALLKWFTPSPSLSDQSLCAPLCGQKMRRSKARAWAVDVIACPRCAQPLQACHGVQHSRNQLQSSNNMLVLPQELQACSYLAAHSQDRLMCALRKHPHPAARVPCKHTLAERWDAHFLKSPTVILLAIAATHECFLLMSESMVLVQGAAFQHSPHNTPDASQLCSSAAHHTAAADWRLCSPC